MTGKFSDIADEEIDVYADILFLLQGARANYHCNRPPRASGALIITPHETAIKAGVSAPEGSPSCDDVGCEIEDGHCVRCVHAEQAAIAQAARMGMPLEGSTIYSINKPCHACTKLIAVAGIRKIVYVYAVYDEDHTRKITEGSNIEMVHVSEDRILEITKVIQYDEKMNSIDIDFEEVGVILEGLCEGLT